MDRREGIKRMSKRAWPGAKIKSFLTIGSVLLAIGLCPPAPAADNAPTADARTAKGELADLLESMAYTAVENRQVLAPVWRQTAALLEAAEKLSPQDPRYPRELYYAALQGGDAEEAMAALNSYLVLVPDDQFAQAQLIDMYLDRMQTAEKMLAYARSLVSKTALPAPVRARAAFHAAQTLLDRSQTGEAIKMLNSAIHIDPLCVQALRMKLQLTHDEGPSRRCGLLLEILRADPLDAGAATTLAGELAELGLPESSAIWYSQAATLYNAAAKPRDAALGRGSAAELYLCGHALDAEAVIQGYLAAIPTDTDAWMIALAIAKDTVSDPGQYAAMQHAAINAGTRRLASVRAAMGVAGAAADAAAPRDAAPTTQPLMSTPDLSGDLPLLVKADQSQLTDDYISAAGDLAWMRLYFLRDAGDDTQRVIDGLQRLLPADDPLVARLVGWSYLVRGQWPEARQKLSAVADRDVYAQMGMVLIDDQAGNRTDADNLAKQTLASHPSGPAAVLLYSAFHGRGAKVIPLPSAEIVTAALQEFPREWLSIVGDPQLFYSVAAEPVDQQIVFPEAILVKLTIQNVSQYDMAIGPDGAIRPQLVFDAATHGLVEKIVGQTAFDQFWQRLVLPQGQFASQVVRLDRGDLQRLLNAQPDDPIDVQFSVMINPIRVPGQLDYVIGGAGCRVPFSSLVERGAVPYKTDDDRKKLYDAMTGASPAQRLVAVTEIATFALGLRTSARGVVVDQSLATAQEMFEHAKKSLTDADPTVRAWAQYVNIIVSPPDLQPNLIQSLTKSEQWYGRVLGLIASRRLSDHGASAASALSNDSDPAVRDYAQAITDELSANSTAQAAAASQPSQ